MSFTAVCPNSILNVLASIVRVITKKMMSIVIELQESKYVLEPTQLLFDVTFIMALPVVSMFTMMDEGNLCAIEFILTLSPVCGLHREVTQQLSKSIP